MPTQEDKNKINKNSNRVFSATDKARNVQGAFDELNREFEERQAQRNANKWQLPYFDLNGFPISQKALRLLTRNEASSKQVIPFFIEGKQVKIGAVDPKSDEVKAIAQDLFGRNYEVEMYLVSSSALESAIQQYRKLVDRTVSGTDEISISAQGNPTKKLKDYEAMRDRITSVSISDLINTILSAAVASRSSDIHLEPREKDINIRFRVDGVLQPIATFPKSVVPRILSRIKLLAKMKINVNNAPQEGHFQIHQGSRDIDLRVSILPTSLGESVTIRLLGVQDLFLHLEDLGMSPEVTKMVVKQLRKKSGMLLTTGPTGSGKTTTLYSFLSYLNKPGIKIITLEDPVEYTLEGITHTPIDSKSGVTFSEGLKMILRQDPDVVMVGEIRDEETAITAAQASLTGHMMLSTLHTNDASGAIPRLMDLGIKPTTLAPALNLLLAQRLLRKICADCREVYRPRPAELEKVKQILSSLSERALVEAPKQLKFFRSSGCQTCNGLGYKGRIGAFEAIEVDEEIEKLIFNQASSREIFKLAVKKGMVTIQQEAVLKAISGVTDLDEVWRVTEG